MSVVSVVMVTVISFASGDELLQILSQQDMEASSPTAGAFLGNALKEEDIQQGFSDLPEKATNADAEERTAAASKHLVGIADGMPTDGRDEELQEALAAETEHKVRRGREQALPEDSDVLKTLYRD